MNHSIQLSIFSFILYVMAYEELTTVNLCMSITEQETILNQALLAIQKTLYDYALSSSWKQYVHVQITLEQESIYFQIF